MKASTLTILLALAGCGTFLGASDDDKPIDPVTADASVVDVAEGDTTVSINDDSGLVDTSGDVANDSPADGPYVNPAACNGKQACARYVFVTSATYRGDFDFANADALCAERADSASSLTTLKGRKWRAWVTTSTIDNALARLGVGGTSTYKRVDEEVFADDFVGLTSGNLFLPINITETGTILSLVSVWTGTGANGQHINTDCTGWGATSGNGKVGVTSKMDNGWTDSGDIPCTDSAHLYCFEY